MNYKQAEALIKIGQAMIQAGKDEIEFCQDFAMAHENEIPEDHLDMLLINLVNETNQAEKSVQDGLPVGRTRVLIHRLAEVVRAYGQGEE